MHNLSSIKRLGVNIDHIATLRQARRSPYPDPVTGAVLAELYGASQITCHIRADRRHIQDADLPRLRDAVQTQLNVEMAASIEMLDVVGDVLAKHPWRHRITLVPENPTEITTEGGLDVAKHAEWLKEICQKIYEKKILVSLFIDPIEEQIRASKIFGVDMIEINTAKYAENDPEDIHRIKKSAQLAQQLGLIVAAGHGLTHHNLPLLVEQVPEIVEYNIGHSIVSQAVFVGWEKAVQDILRICRTTSV